MKWRALPGLPGTGPPPLQFSLDGRGTHREGYVVEFHPDSDRAWAGNFQRGFTRFHAVLAHPDGRCVIVVAGGDVFWVDPDERTLYRSYGSHSQSVLALPEHDLLIFEDGLSLEAIGKEGVRWHTGRISWDGIWGMEFRDGTVTGKAWDAVEDVEVRFSVDPRSGAVEGGAGRYWAGG